MKKPVHQNSSNNAVPSTGRHGRRGRKREGGWEFTSNGRLFLLGAMDAVRRAAYRTTSGEMRFLPL